MPENNDWVLWKNEEMSLEAAFHPAISRSEGFHLVLLQKKGVASPSPWADPKLYAKMSLLAAKASRVIRIAGMADWINIHYDGNIGAAKGNPKMHIHIFGRLKTGKLWGGPLQLPSGEGSHGNEPLTEEERAKFREVFVLIEL